MLFDFLLYPPKPLINTKLDNETEVDTCVAGDTRRPETGVRSKLYNNGKWIIVEEYEDEKTALAGHKRWVKTMERPPSVLHGVGTSTAGQLAAIAGEPRAFERNTKKEK